MDRLDYQRASHDVYNRKAVGLVALYNSSSALSATMPPGGSRRADGSGGRDSGGGNGDKGQLRCFNRDIVCVSMAMPPADSSLDVLEVAPLNRFNCDERASNALCRRRLSHGSVLEKTHNCPRFPQGKHRSPAAGSLDRCLSDKKVIYIKYIYHPVCLFCARCVFCARRERGYFATAPVAADREVCVLYNSFSWTVWNRVPCMLSKRPRQFHGRYNIFL